MDPTEHTPASHADVSVARWIERVGERAAGAMLRTSEGRNVAPGLLEAILARDEARAHALLGEHLGARMRGGHELSDILQELTAISRAVSDAWSDLEPARRPPRSELDRALAGLQRCVVWVIGTFTKHMRDDEQRGKRAIHRLEAEQRDAIERGLASDVLAARMLAVVLDVMECDAGALLLYDASSAQLVEVAASGLPRDAIEREVVDVGSQTFPATVARSDAPVTEVGDVATTELDVSPALRASGIRAMLGVRMPARTKLFGVLYVAMRRPHVFGSREVRRLELLGERVLVHLEIAYLNAALRASLDEVLAERKAREQFVSFLVHDLRTPLSNAKVSAQLLARLPDGDPRRADLTSRIVRGVDRADAMLRDLLDVSRIRAGGTLPLSRAPADLFDVVHAVVAELPTGSARRIALDVDHARGTWDAHELERALGNVVSNALKYGDETAPITIRAKGDAEVARLSVHNAGSPLEPAQLERIFEPFVQQSEGRGWGLGLALVRACAEAHGGRALVQSDAEHGTVFTIELPTTAPTAPDDRGAQPTA
ncbi:sensor histidine kinase [Sandaracinus amylolyticus]|uniref:sensor histidine kinase n=1 Tax=Sandaracinus amylolyticus TaxID=927083 RepID=UPI00069E781B|nr:GAF domain-containing sensor histidine kinase [Sandaracinus amylolyticus]